MILVIRFDSKVICELDLVLITV